MLVGYGRVSTQDQHLAIQEEALLAAGCEKVFAEKKSGRSADDRAALAEALDFLRAGDTLVVTRLDRLARSARDLHNIVAALDEKGVGFRCLSQATIDTTTSTGKLMMSVLAAVAAFETDIRAERQAEGIAKARAAGKYRGRTPTIDYGQIKKLHGQGISPTDIGKLLGCGRTSVYRALAAA